METAKQLTLVENKGISLHTWDDLVKRSEFLAKSQLIPEAIRGKPHDIAVILQMGNELGIDPMQAVNGINCIKGKPSVSPELAIALIRSRLPGAFIKFNEVSESKCSVTMARSKDDLDQSFTSVWTMSRAQSMGLANNHNYKTQPGTMLKWRAVGEAARTVFPDLLKGIYVDEELDHLPDVPTGSKAEKIAKLLEPKEVVSEVVGEANTEAKASTPGEELTVGGEAQPLDTILGDYVVPEELKCALSGMSLKSITEEKLIEFLDSLDAKIETKRKTEPNFELTGKWLEFKTRADQYLGN